ncbi:glycosyltransferase family 4 protein [Candidatus Berkelbacteria bacterium]|nr:glycosyltransferase family 4 protein [Candidatus Berkelbacteria bacterium]
MNLHIGLDGSRIAKAHYTGTEHYSHQIFEQMFRVAPHHRYTIYAPALSTKPLKTANAQVDWRIIPFPKLWTHVRLSAEFLMHCHTDVLFIPSHTVPLIHPTPTVSTIHDLGFKRFPEYYSRLERVYQEFGLTQALRASTRIITFSAATKRDILHYTQFPASKIHVIHHGVDREIFHPVDPLSKPSLRIHEYMPYLYSIGRLEAKKNTVQLLRAFRILKEKYQMPHHLVIAGTPGQYGYAEIEQVLKELPQNTRDDIHLLGYLSDQAHATWLRFASCLVFVSGFEGFGLPIVEAMASGIPVVASNISSMPEIVGPAGILVNHTRAEAIAEGILPLLKRQYVQKSLQSKGLERAKQFSWERAALTTVGVLESAVQEVRNAH